MCVCVCGRALPVRHHQLGHLSEEQDAVDAGGLTPGSFPPITFRSFAQSSVQSYSFKRRSTEVSRTYTWLDTVRHLRRERVARTVSSRVKAAAAAGLKTVRVESGRPVPPPASNVSRCVLFSTNYTRGSHLSHTIRTPFAHHTPRIIISPCIVMIVIKKKKIHDIEPTPPPTTAHSTPQSTSLQYIGKLHEENTSTTQTVLYNSTNRTVWYCTDTVLSILIY